MNPFNLQTPIEGVRHVIVVGSGKGGVGKSTVAANLARSLVMKGLKVGLLDADIYGPSVPRMFGTLNQKPEMTDKQKIIPIRRQGLALMSIGYLVPDTAAVVWRGPMLFKVMEQFFRDVLWGELDYLIVDLPPGTGDVALTVAQKVPVTGAVVVTTPQNMALADAKKAVDMFERIKIPVLGVIENMSYFKPTQDAEPTRLFPVGDLDIYLKTKELKKLGEIPFHPNVGISCEAGIPIVESDPTSEEAMAFSQAADLILEGVNLREKVTPPPTNSVSAKHTENSLQ